MPYSVDLAGFEEQIARLEKYDQSANNRLREAVTKSVMVVSDRVVENSPEGVSGHFRASITSRVETGLGSAVGIVTSSLVDDIYPLVVEFGRRPGAPPPPVAAISRWVDLETGDPGAAYAIARSIGKRGIPAKAPFKKGLEAAQSRVMGFFEKAIELIMGDLGGG